MERSIAESLWHEVQKLADPNNYRFVLLADNGDQCDVEIRFVEHKAKEPDFIVRACAVAEHKEPDVMATASAAKDSVMAMIITAIRTKILSDEILRCASSALKR